MTNIFACIDGSPAMTAVCDAAAWAAANTGLPVTLLHVLEKNEFEGQADLSGNIGLGSREHLLKELAELDHQRSRQGTTHTHDLIGSNIENVIRTLANPIMVVQPSFQVPSRFLFAYDASPTAKKVLELIASSPLLKGLECDLVMVAEPTDEHERQLVIAKQVLKSAGIKVEAKLLQRNGGLWPLTDQAVYCGQHHHRNTENDQSLSAVAEVIK